MITSLKKQLYDNAGVFKLSIINDRLFVIGLVIKLYAATFFTSHNFGTLFIPFLKYDASVHDVSAYSYFYKLGITDIFPYPQLMLFIMSLPGKLFYPFLDLNIFHVGSAELFTYHLPILLADITILVVLSRWLKNKQRSLLIWYWLSPILFYINYLHSQLDVIPIALVFIFLYFLSKERYIFSYIFLGAAIATKFHIIILLPFTLLYLWRTRKQITPLLECLVVASGLFVLINNFELLSPAFKTLVFENREQFKIFDLQIIFGSTNILYIIPFAFTLLCLHALTYKRFNRDTFVMFLGFSFGLLTLLIPPMQGWYYWVVPFLIYFYVKNERYSKTNLVLLSIAYFIYFACIPNSDYLSIFSYLSPDIAALPNLYHQFLQLGLPADLISNLTFGILQAVLLINVIWLYKRGVDASQKSKLYNMPYLIGVAGDSGSGKSTFATLLSDIFSEKNVAVVAGDAMHKWERGHAMWQTFTHLNPQANALHEDLENALHLQNGDTIYRRHYDHHTGTFTVPEKLESKKIVLFEGLHSFYLSHMQKALDLKIFIMPEEQLRIHWKLCRDMNERGYTKDNVLAQLLKRAGDSQKFINVQQQYADITISLKSKQDLSDSVGLDIPLDLYLEIKCDNTINIDRLLTTLTDKISIEHQFTEQSHIIRFYGDIEANSIEQASYLATPELYDILVHEPTWSNNYNGVLQLFICYYMLESLRLKTKHEL